MRVFEPLAKQPEWVAGQGIIGQAEGDTTAQFQCPTGEANKGHLFNSSNKAQEAGQSRGLYHLPAEKSAGNNTNNGRKLAQPALKRAKSADFVHQPVWTDGSV
jgi:hypothetical protein